MATPQLSPGVLVREVDLTVGRADNVLDNIGAIANYYPDFVVQSSNGKNYIIETKGRVDIKDPLKINGLKEWCKDVNSCNPTREYDFIFVDQEKFDKLSGVKSKRDNVLATFNDLIKNFNEYKD